MITALFKDHSNHGGDDQFSYWVLPSRRMSIPAERRDLSACVRDEFGVQAGRRRRIGRCTTDERQGAGLLLLGG